MFRHLLGTWIRGEVRRHAADAVGDAVRRATGSPDAPGADTDTGRTPAVAPPCDVAVIFAMGIEAGGLVDLLQDAATTGGSGYTEHVGRLARRHLSIVESGVGCEAAARATEDVLRLRKPKWIVSTGFAGGLKGELARYDVVMADAIVDADGRRLATGMKMDPATVAATPGLHVGRLLTVDRVIRRPEEKERLGVEHDAVACDMESMAVARVCTDCKVRFVSVRIISDAMSDRLPREVHSLLEQSTTSARLGAAAGAIFRRPSSVKDLWQLKEDAIVASDRLARFLAGVVEQLPVEDEQS